MKQFAVRNQSKFNKIRHSPDPVQSKSSPMLISNSGYNRGNRKLPMVSLHK